MSNFYLLVIPSPVQEALVSFYYRSLLGIAFYIPRIKDIEGEKCSWFCTLIGKETVILVSITKYQKFLSNALQPKKGSKIKHYLPVGENN